MKDLAILLRCMQLYTHNAHNIVKGTTFFQDHNFLGELYPLYEESYDSIIERMIGLNQLNEKDIISVQVEAVNYLKNIKLDSKDIFQTIVICEKELQELCSKIKGSLGTLNLVAQISDDSESRVYKIQQRLK